jgi:SNF2 family DNA or RNA helicase
VLPHHIPFLNKIKWNRVICDEAHHASHRNTTAYKGMMLLNTPMMWMVTGTPIQNKKAEMVNLLRVITKNAPQSSTIKSMVYYRTKANVAISMPPLHQHNIMVECETNAEEELSRHIHSMVQYCGVPKKRIAIEEALEEDPQKLTMKYFMLARQACVYPPMLQAVSRRFEMQLSEHRRQPQPEYEPEHQPQYEPEHQPEYEPEHQPEHQPEQQQQDTTTTSSEYSIITPADLYTSESKLDSLIATINGRINNGCGKIIMCYFHEEIDAIANRLAPYGKRIVKLDGRSTKTQRTTALTKPADILIGQIRMCSEGLNLQEHYSEVYFTSPHFNPAIEQQAIARCWRIGQKKEVNVFRFINHYKEKGNEHTMDTYSEKIQIVKKNILCQFEEEAMRTPMAPKLKLLDTKFINKPQPQRIRDRFIKLKKKDRKPTTMTTMTAAHHT